MHIEEIINQITPLDAGCMRLAQERLDKLIKPVGSLDKLEKLVVQYAGITGKYKKEELENPKKALLVWCGIEQASAAEQLLRDAWPVNVLAKSVGADVYPLLVVSESLSDALEEGVSLVQEIISKENYGLVAFGCVAPSEDSLVQAAMAGGMLQAAAVKTLVLLDGVASCDAALRAVQLAENVRAYLWAGHLSAEEGAAARLERLGLSSCLKLQLPEGVGEGAAVACTLVDAALKTYREMETFEEAGVTGEVKAYSRHEELTK